MSKRVCLSRLAAYKMSQEDIVAYLEKEGIDTSRDSTLTIEDDGAMVCYEQEEEDG